MRIGRVGSYPALFAGDARVDVAAASGGRFGTEDAVFESWPEFRDRAGSADVDGHRHPLAGAERRAPRSTPRQVFGAGLNYHSHLAEAGRPVPDPPLLFTEFPASLCGPGDDIELATGRCDFEAVTTLPPGDLVFTGTAAGVGVFREPPLFENGFTIRDLGDRVRLKTPPHRNPPRQTSPRRLQGPPRSVTRPAQRRDVGEVELAAEHAVGGDLGRGCGGGEFG